MSPETPRPRNRIALLSGFVRVLAVTAFALLLLIPLGTHVSKHGIGGGNTALASDSTSHGPDTGQPRTDRANPRPAKPDCPENTFCSWHAADFAGTADHTELATAELERCLPLPADRNASSFVNRTNHPVTVYEDEHCGSEQDFATYPSGSHVPRAEHPVRAIQIWEH